MSDGTVIPGRPRGSNPFPFDSPFLDTLSRLGFQDLEEAAEVESFWWFMGSAVITPDDLASAIMAILPPESEKEASLRRMGIHATHEVERRTSTILKKKARKGSSK